MTGFGVRIECGAGPSVRYLARESQSTHLIKLKEMY